MIDVLSSCALSRDVSARARQISSSSSDESGRGQVSARGQSTTGTWQIVIILFRRRSGGWGLDGHRV